MIIRETIRTIKRGAGTWTLSIVALAVGLVVIGVAGILAAKSYEEIERARSQTIVEVFFQSDLSSEEAGNIARQAIEPLSSIEQSTFISKEQALEEYDSASGEKIEAALGSNPLPASVKLKIKNSSSNSLEKISERLRRIDGVEEVRADVNYLRNLEKRSSELNYILSLFGGLLLILVFSFVIVSTRLLLLIRTDTMKTMRMLGASWWTIVAPFLLESAIAGTLASFIALFTVFTIYRYVLLAISPGLSISIRPLSTPALIFGIFGCSLLISIIGASIAALFRIRKLDV